MLVAIIDSHVGIGLPNEDAINSAIASVEVIEVTIHCVPASNRIVKVSIMHHHLGLDKTGLRPLKGREGEPRWIIPDADSALGAPMHEIRKPLLMSERSAGNIHSFPCLAQCEAWRRIEQ